MAKKRKPQDATLRNVRAANKRLDKLERVLERILIPVLDGLQKRQQDHHRMLQLLLKQK